jgi:hypothetical protein
MLYRRELVSQENRFLLPSDFPLSVHESDWRVPTSKSNSDRAFLLPRGKNSQEKTALLKRTCEKTSGAK